VNEAAGNPPNPAATNLAILLWACDPDDPARLATPFFHASAAAAMDVQVEVYFTARSVLLLQPGVAASLYAATDRRKSIYGYMREAVSLGARFFACADALAAHGLSRDALVPEVSELAGAVSFIDRVMQPGWRTLTY